MKKLLQYHILLQILIMLGVKQFYVWRAILSHFIEIVFGQNKIVDHISNTFTVLWKKSKMVF